ncbi:hypothetical protein GCM10009067_29930 [Haloarcula sebkhae]|uniref:Uncharacterized protein n=1 Tax=Haloarcula sebkhae TaxID=932660 RepID=A0A830ETR7_9EURY|nr:hypothetical protein GCM10009067_29930 [Haloarcula sebkhae]
MYPDPVAGGDEGEFVVLSVPDGIDIGQYAVTDGDGIAGDSEHQRTRARRSLDGTEPDTGTY